jgi:ubiquinone biosynthesis protein Coq4
MNLWDKLRILKSYVLLVRDPNRTDLIFRQVRILTKNPELPAVKAIEQVALANPDFRAMYEQRYLPDSPKLEDLARLPENSFGRAVYNHMHTHGLSFDIFPRVHSDRAIDYLTTRLYQDHDLWHVLLGCSVDVEDELAIQAFGVAQYRSPVGTMIISGGLLHLLGKNPIRAIEAIRKVAEAYVLGQKARFLPSIRLVDHFAKPLEDVRAFCGLA